MLKKEMNKTYKKYQNYIIPICLILLLSFSRLIPHSPNFTPILAAGIFSGFYFRNFFLSAFIVIFSMFLGDIYLGFHETMIFTYISLAIAVVLGLYVKQFSFKEIFFAGLGGSVCFFLVTNFGAWLTLDMYEKNIFGLIQSYILAIPFFGNTLISTFLNLFIIKIIFDFLKNQNTAKYFFNNMIKFKD